LDGQHRFPSTVLNAAPYTKAGLLTLLRSVVSIGETPDWAGLYAERVAAHAKSDWQTSVSLGSKPTCGSAAAAR